MNKNIFVFFGGISMEHEVSIITGLQVVENIDREKFNVYVVYVTPSGEFRYCGNLISRKNFNYYQGKPSSTGLLSTIMNIGGKGYLLFKDLIFNKKIAIDVAYLAFHGGNGENGEFQGYLHSMCIPTTSSFTEGSVIAQNKIITKEVLSHYEIDTLKGWRIESTKVLKDYESETKKLSKEEDFTFPLILKPAHLGSSIGVTVVHNITELQKSLLELSHLDSEILIEKYIENFREFNCSVRRVNNKIVASPVEKPISKNEILNFADKYQSGEKSKASGMAGLSREIPAKIESKLSEKIQSLSKKIYKTCRCKGLVRIDFIVTQDNDIYLMEINSIPGSMSYYLWEAEGITFKEQITESIEQAELDYQEKVSKNLSYDTDIVKKFINSANP